MTQDQPLKINPALIPQLNRRFEERIIHTKRIISKHNWLESNTQKLREGETHVFFSTKRNYGFYRLSGKIMVINEKLYGSFSEKWLAISPEEWANQQWLAVKKRHYEIFEKFDK